MKLSVDYTYTTIHNPARHIVAKLKNLLSASPSGYRFTRAFKSGRWDGRISLYDAKTNTFPTGLLHLVKEEFKEELHIVDTRIFPRIGIHTLDLRTYQQEAVIAVLETTNCVLNMAPNAGKTYIMAALLQMINSGVIVVPSRALLLQTSSELEELLDIEVGRYGAGYNIHRPVTVTTMHSLHKLISENDLSSNVFAIIDECHRTKSNTIFDNIFSVPGMYRVGMSGTPLTYDKLSDFRLIAATGPIVYTVTNKDLIEMGYSEKPVITFVRASDFTNDEDYDNLEYMDAYRKFIVSYIPRNAQIADIAISERNRGPVLIMVDWEEHANNILKLLPESMLLTGAANEQEIKGTFSNLASGGILTCTPILKEGINIPEIATIILAAGGKSHIQLLQRIGRGQRKSDREFRVYDFIDGGNSYLLKHSRQRYKLYKDTGFELKLQ